MRKELIGIIAGITMLLASCSKGQKGTVEPPPPPPPPPPAPTTGLTKQNVRSYMVDSNATAETVAMFYNLKILSKTKFAIGQQDAFSGFYKNNGGMSDIKKTTGNDPALLGLDFMFITDKSNNGQPSNWFYQQEVNIINVGSPGTELEFAL